MVKESESSKAKKDKNNIMPKKDRCGGLSRNESSRRRLLQKSVRSENIEESSQRIKSGDARKRRSRSDKKKPKPLQCSMLSDACPIHVSHNKLMGTAADDRRRREYATFDHMVKEFNMTELMLWRAMERQYADASMRSWALYLEAVCVVVLGITGVLAQHYFNTRGDLHYYLKQMTFELFLFSVVIVNITITGLGTRLTNVGVFVFAVGVNLCHILMTVRLKGTFFRCEKSEILLQHCLLKLIPTHYHALYMSMFLLVLHLAIALVLAFAVIFYDGSLDWHLEHAPGAQEWITSEPLHEHNRLAVIHEQARKSKSCKHDISAEFSLSDLPIGSYIIREQAEHTVQQTTIDSSGKKYVGPEEVTISKSYSLDVPGADRVTKRQCWTKRKLPKSTGTPSRSTNLAAATNKSIEAKSSEKPTNVPSKSTPIKRNLADKDVELETWICYISRMPPLISQIAYLNNKNLIEKQSDYLY